MPDAYQPRGFTQRVREIEPFRVVEVLTRATELSTLQRLAGVLG